MWRPNPYMIPQRKPNYTLGNKTSKERLHSLYSSGKLIKSETVDTMQFEIFVKIISFTMILHFTPLNLFELIHLIDSESVFEIYMFTRVNGIWRLPEILNTTPCIRISRRVSSNLGNNYLPFNFIDFFWLNDIMTPALSLRQQSHDTI